MDIKVSRIGPVASLNMNGDFRLHVRSSFKDAYTPLLEDSGISTLDIVLADVEKIDSSALGMLLILLDRAQAVGKKVILSKANSYVSMILDIADFEKQFTIC